VSPGAAPAHALPRRDPPWPTELRFRSRDRRLAIAFDDGWSGEIPYELLRVESPSAETRGHGAGERPPPPARKRKVNVVGADPVGRYAVRIRFDDGHDTGLYTWAYLRELAEQADQRMAAYLARMDKLGLKRD
jgi:DUF971 family protein